MQFNKDKCRKRSVVLLSVLCLALASGAAAGEPSAIKSFERPAEIDSEADFSRAAEQYFDFAHEVYSISEDGKRIVVGDISFPVAPGVETDGFQTGMYVGLRFNAEREVVEIERLERPGMLEKVE